MIRTMWPLVLAAAAVPSPAHAADDCRKAGAGQPCQVVIDRSVPVSGQTVTVENETRVTVLLIKQSPFESCNSDVKREELPDVDVVQALFALVKDLAASLVFLTAAPAAAAANTPEHIASMLDAVAHVAAMQLAAADGLQTQYDAEATNLKAFYRTTSRLHAYATGAIKDETAFETDRAARAAAVTVLDRLPLPNTAGGDATYKAILTEFTTYARSAAATPAVVASLEEQINRARTMLDGLEKTVDERASVISTCDTQTAWLEGESMASVLRGSDFKLEDLKEARTTVYLCLPAMRLGTHGRWLRLMIGMALEALERTGPLKENQHRVLFCLDEFAVLGHMQPIERAAGQIAGFGVKLWPVIQDLTQLQRDYQKAWETFMGNAGLLTFFGNTDLTTLEHISKRLGETEVIRTVTNPRKHGNTRAGRVRRGCSTPSWDRVSPIRAKARTGRQPHRLGNPATGGADEP